MFALGHFRPNEPVVPNRRCPFRSQKQPDDLACANNSRRAINGLVYRKTFDNRIDEQTIGSSSRYADAYTAHPAPARRRGSRTVNSVKSPTLLSTVMVPPCCNVTIS